MTAQRNVIKKRTLYFTLFESQLIRTYLLADNSFLLEILTKEFDIVIITSTELESLVEEGIRKSALNGLVQVSKFNNYKDSAFTRVISFILYWSNRSPAINLRIGRGLFEDKRSFKMVFRWLTHKAIPTHKNFTKFLRLIYLKSLKVDSLEKYFDRANLVTNSDLLFVTSLTNAWEDLPVAAYFKRKNVQIVGTVRSWDNLTNHGFLKFIPDVFLSHSEAMLKYANKYQNFSSSRIIESVTPVYQEKYRITKTRTHDDVIKIAYMCMGGSTNPDDINFIRWLINEWKNLPNKFHLTILQHPKFIMNIDKVFLDGNIAIMVFKYENSNLMDYYNFIAQQDLVVCGGTTAALDAAFIGIPILAVGFEVVEQNYWTSALRYFDTKLHTKDFFEVCNVLIVKDKTKLLNYLIKYEQISHVNEELVSKFTGKSSVNFNSILLEALS